MNIATIDRLRFQPGDILLAKMARSIASADVGAFGKTARAMLDHCGHPTVPVIILENDFDLTVLSRRDADALRRALDQARPA